MATLTLELARRYFEQVRQWNVENDDADGREWEYDMSEYTALGEDVAHYLGSLPFVLGDEIYFGGLTDLSVGAVRELARSRASLWLDKLTTVPLESARALVEHQGSLSLGGLEEVSPEVADALSRHAGRLYMDGLKRLPGHNKAYRRLARKFANGGANPVPASLQRLDDQIAKIFGEMKIVEESDENSIHLPNCCRYSGQALWHLGRYPGRVYLRTPDPLDDATADILGRYRGDLHLWELTRLDEGCGFKRLATKLAMQEGATVLGDLKHLAPGPAARLAGLGMELVEPVAPGEVFDFHLHVAGGWEPNAPEAPWDDPAAPWFEAGFQIQLELPDPLLSLPAIETLSNETAAALAAGKARLDLSALSCLDSSPGHLALVRKLAREGTGYDPRRCCLPGLRRFSAEAAGYLLAFGGDLILFDPIASHDPIATGPLLSNLRRLFDSPGHRTLIGMLSGTSRTLDLSNVRAVPEAILELLYEHVGGLILGYETLTDDLADYLSIEATVELTLPNLMGMTDHQAGLMSMLPTTSESAKLHLPALVDSPPDHPVVRWRLGGTLTQGYAMLLGSLAWQYGAPIDVTNFRDIDPQAGEYLRDYRSEGLRIIGFDDPSLPNPPN